MKKTLFATVIGLSLIVGSSIVRGQTDEKPVPKAPYLASVPDYAHWIVTFKYEADAPTTSPVATNAPSGQSAAPAAPEGFPTSIETIKTGDLRGIVVTYTDGTSKHFTCQGDWVLASTPKGPQLSIANKMAAPYLYYTTGFILVDGVRIDPSTFKEAALQNNVMAFHYKSGSEDVWIDPNSMLPLSAKQNGIQVSYEFLTPPPRPFDIPKDQATLLQKEQQAYKATNSMR